MPRPRPRVLILAEHCNPEWVSVPLVAWSLYHALSRITDAHLVTQIRNRDAMLRAGLLEGRDFTTIDTEFVARRTNQLFNLLGGSKGIGWTINTALVAAAYPAFEHLAWKRFGCAIRAGRFDVVHRLTPLSPTVPSLIAAHCRRAGVPFVVGPLNGGVPWPRGFGHAQRKEREFLHYVRNAYKLLPGYHSTRSDSAAILVASRDTYRQLSRPFRHKAFYLPENAIDPNRFSRRRTRKADRPLRLVFIGRLVPYKGPDLLLHAAAPLLKSGDVTLDIVGDGALMPELKAIIERENLPNVTLAGWVPHEKIQDRIADADLFAFPSIREFGGGVVLEAMAVGLVPVVIDYGGPAELVTQKTGYLIPLGTRDQIIDRFRQTLTYLTNNPPEIDAKSAHAIRRAHAQFTWDAKAGQVIEIYRWLTGASRQKPAFPMPTPDLNA